MAMLMAALPSLLNTMYGRLLNPASIRAVRRSESVIHSGFLTTEVTGDGKTGCDDWHPWTWQTATCRSYYRTMHQCRSQAMGCSRSSPPRAWLDHTRDGGDVLEHLRILLLLLSLLPSILVGGFLNILVCIAVESIVACGWWGLFAFLSRGFDNMAGNDWTRKKRSKSIIYSLVWIIQCTFTQSFIYG